MRRISTFLALAVVSLLTWSTTADAADRLVLVEEWNSATCPPCVPATEILNDVVDYREGVVSIRMHMWWPAPNDPWQNRDRARGDMGRTRIGYYDSDGSYSIPYGWVDGTRNPNMTNRDDVTNVVNLAKTQQSQVIMSIEEDRSDMENIAVNVTVEGEAGSNIGAAKLHVVVVARKVLLPNLPTTLPSHNGEILHTDVGLDMLPSPAGTDINVVAGEPTTYNFNYSLDYDELAPEDQIYIIAFVQNDFNRQVYQSATNIDGHELNVEWNGAETVRLSADERTVKRTFTVTNDDDSEVTAEATYMTLPTGITASFSPQSFTIPVDGSQEVEVTYTYAGDDVVYERSLIQVRAVLPEGYAPGEVADLEILEPQIFAGTPELILWTGFNRYTADVYERLTLNFAGSKYANKAVAILGTAENMSSIGDDVKYHILPMRFDPQLTGSNAVLGDYVLNSVQRWITAGNRVAVFNNVSAGLALTTPTPDGFGPAQQFFSNVLGVTFNRAPVQRYTLNQGGGAAINAFTIGGVANDPIGNGIAVDPANAYNPQGWNVFDAFTDQMSIGAGPAEPVFFVDGASGNVAAVRAEIGAEGRIYYGGFGLEAVAPNAQRVLIMNRILDWLYDDGVVGPQIDAAITIDFGTVTSIAPKTEAYVIRNTGTEALTITDIQVQDEPAFTIESVTLPLVIEPGQSASIDVTFTPTETKEYLAFMTVEHNATNESTLFVDLTGMGEVVSSVASNEAQNDEMNVRTVQNPFVGSTLVEYSLTTEAAQNVNITVHNVAGQEVAQLVDGLVTPGTHSTRFDGTQLPGGTYFIVMKSGDQSITVPAVNVK